MIADDRFVHRKERFEHARNEPDDSAMVVRGGCVGGPRCRQDGFGRCRHERDALRVAFHLRVEQCQEPVGLVAKFTFGDPSDAVAGQPDLFTLDGPENVGLELADENEKNIAPGAGTRFNALGNGEIYTFNARLREIRPTVRGGHFSRRVRVLVEFM